MRFYFSIVIVLFSVVSQASIEIIQEKKQSYQPDPAHCASQGICDLKNFRFVEQKKKVVLPEMEVKNAFWMTDTRAVYETATLDQIEKYAVVQMIRGCIYESTWDGQTMNKYLNVVRNHMGKTVIFQHKTWQIDNDYMGPIYTGVQMDDGQVYPFYLLNWNNDKNSLDADHSHFYGEQKPPHPVVFATDLPGAAALREKFEGIPLQAQNVSLEYKTCLFKTADLPKTTDAAGTGVEMNKALKCFSWDHKFIYDFKTSKFNRPAAIEQFCLK